MADVGKITKQKKHQGKQRRGYTFKKTHGRRTEESRKKKKKTSYNQVKVTA